MGTVVVRGLRARCFAVVRMGQSIFTQPSHSQYGVLLKLELHTFV